MTTLGHVQRGGTPTAFDRVLATRYGVAAVDLVQNGNFGRMVTLEGSNIKSVPLSDVTGQIQMVDPELYELAKVFFG